MFFNEISCLGKAEETGISGIPVRGANRKTGRGVYTPSGFRSGFASDRRMSGTDEPSVKSDIQKKREAEIELYGGSAAATSKVRPVQGRAVKARGPKSKGVPPQLAPFRELARSTIRRHNARHASRPKCGAKRKHDGKPCQHPAMANGRCYFHGGVTPSGKDWHKVRWPENPVKLRRKLRDRERIEARRKQRVAAMTAEERAKYERHRLACRPGTPAQRQARRASREQAKDAARIIQQPRKAAADPAQAALAAEIEALKAKAARLKRRRSEMTQGVFG